jgi:hypothetical protein
LNPHGKSCDLSKYARSCALGTGLSAAFPTMLVMR